MRHFLNVIKYLFKDFMFLNISKYTQQNKQAEQNKKEEKENGKEKKEKNK